MIGCPDSCNMFHFYYLCNPVSSDKPEIPATCFYFYYLCSPVSPDKPQIPATCFYFYYLCHPVSPDKPQIPATCFTSTICTVQCLLINQRSQQHVLLLLSVESSVSCKIQDPSNFKTLVSSVINQDNILSKFYQRP